MSDAEKGGVISKVIGAIDRAAGEDTGSEGTSR